MRLKAELWVQAYLRRCSVLNVSGYVLHRGDCDAGAIYIRINSLDGCNWFYGPAPSGVASGHHDRYWVKITGVTPLGDKEADEYVARQLEYDPDIWVVEIEDRDGRHYLGDALLEI